MFENLSDKLDAAFKSLKGQGRITELNVASTIKDIRRALVDADVHYKIAKELTDKIKEEALGANVLTAVAPGKLMTKLVQDGLTELMGGEIQEINLKGKPTVILIAGLQGSGKTTFTAKLGKYLKSKKARTPLLVACDVYRPAAIDQLKVLGEQESIEVFSIEGENDPVKIARKGIEHARDTGMDLVIIDTAGRLAIDEQMMEEISNIKEAAKPNETLFVVDAMTGQDAVNTAKTFNERLDFDGAVLTKLDGDARGGAALSIRYIVDKPIKFIGTGEGMDALDVFHPDRMAQRILGMGDVVSFVERAQEQFDEKEAEALQRKISRNKLNFNDFLDQLKQIKKMGDTKELLSMIPGMDKQVKEEDIDEASFGRIEAMIFSMTPHEREFPHVIDGNRRKRIASGSGNSIQEVNKFLKQFDEMQSMMRTMQKLGKGGRMMQNLPFTGKGK